MLIAAATMLAFTACSDDDDEQVIDTPQPDEAEVVIPDFGTPFKGEAIVYNVTANGSVNLQEQLNSIEQEMCGGNSEDSDLWQQWIEAQRDSLEEASDRLGANGSSMFGYDWQTYTYKSVDCEGSEITLSGLISYPMSGWFSYSYPEPENIIIGCHVTITSDKERPSKFASYSTDVGMLSMHASTSSTQSLVIMPDYEGYGATKSRAHPYLYQELTARQVIDGVYAGLAIYEKKYHKMTGKPTVALGYSQGGSVAMAVHRYIEENNLAEELNFKGSVCGDGPYDPVRHMRQYVSDGVVKMPCVLPLIIKGMVDSNPYIRGKYTAADYLSEGLIASGALDDIASKNYTTDEINDRILAYSKKNGNCLTNPSGVCTMEKMCSTGLYQYLRGASMSDEEAKPYAALIKALELNNLVADWTPQHGIYTFHSTRDEVVPYCNYETAASAWKHTNFWRGRPYAGSSWGHVDCGTKFYLWKEGSMVRALLNDSWKDESVEKTMD